MSEDRRRGGEVFVLTIKLREKNQLSVVGTSVPLAADSDGVALGYGCWQQHTAHGIISVYLHTGMEARVSVYFFTYGAFNWKRYHFRCR